MFTKFSELTDVVSILPYCPEDGSWGLLRSYPETKRHKSICQEYRLISVKVYHNDWRLTAYKACKQLLKSVCDAGSHWCSNGVLVKLLKIWLPQEAQENGPLNIHHAVFQMILTTREKASIQTDLSKMGELTWHKDLTALKGDMLTPEIIQYVNQECCNRDTATFLPEHFLRDNIVVELVKEDFLLNRDSDDPFDELVMSTGFSVEDEIGLYEQYLIHTFPYCTMGQGSFTKFMTNFGWSPEATNHLFKCADFEGRGALLPKELLYLMAALEPEVSLSPRSACIRGVYIFRFYDFNNDGHLDMEEFKALVTALLQGKTVCKKTMDEEVKAAYRMMGVGEGCPGVSMDRMMTGLSCLQASSALMRNNTKLSRYLATIPRRPRPPVCSNEDKTQPELYSSGVKRGLAENGGRCAPLGKMKLNIDCRGPTGMQRLADLPEDMSRRSVRKMSAVADSSNDPLVEACKLLKVLNYFTKRIEAEPQEDWSTDVLQGTPSETKQISNRDSTMGKHAFAWGQMTNRVLVCSLMEVCEVLLARFRNEPRLLELDSPVHIMGGLTGNFKDVYCLEKLLWKNGLDWTAGNFLFLGGYVGEGQMVDEMAGGDCDSSLELISYLFANKARNPDTVYMIRGLHEIRSIQKENTFLTECKDKYGDEIGEGVWEGVNMVLDCMPLAAIVDKKIFCCSGGIPGPWICPTIQIIKSVVPCPLPKPQEQSLLAWQLMVNSPHSGEVMDGSTKLEALSKKGFLNSREWTGGLVFTRPALNNFLTVNGLCTLVTSRHSPLPHGYQVRYRGRMVCLSSGQSLGSGRDPAVLLVTSRWHPPRIVTLHTASLLPPLGLLEVPPEEEEEEVYWPIDNGQVSLANSAFAAPK